MCVYEEREVRKEKNFFSIQSQGNSLRRGLGSGNEKKKQANNRHYQRFPNVYSSNTQSRH